MAEVANVRGAYLILATFRRGRWRHYPHLVEGYFQARDSQEMGGGVWTLVQMQQEAIGSSSGGRIRCVISVCKELIPALWR